MTELDSVDRLQSWIRQTPNRNAISVAARAVLRALPSSLDQIAKQSSTSFSEQSLSSFRGLASIFSFILNPQHSRDYLEDASLSAFRSSTFLSDAIAYLCKSTYSEFSHSEWSVAQSILLVVGQAHQASQSSQQLKEIFQDIEFLSDGGSPERLVSQPLWGKTRPKDAAESWLRAKSVLLERHNEHWHVWTDWYDQRLDGVQANEQAELQVALLPSEIWESGPNHINTEIEAIWQSRAQTSPTDLPDLHKILGHDELRIAISDFDYEDLSSLMMIVPFESDFPNDPDGVYFEDSRNFIEAIRGIIRDLESDIFDRQSNMDPRLSRYLQRYFKELSLDQEHIRPARLFDLSKTLHDILLDDDLIGSLDQHVVHQIERMLDYSREVLRGSFAGALSRMMLIENVAPLNEAELEEAIDDFESLSLSVINREWDMLPPPSDEVIAIISDLRDEIHEVKSARDLSASQVTTDRRHKQLVRKVKVGVSTVLRFILKSISSASEYHASINLPKDAVDAVNQKVSSEIMQNPTLKKFMRKA